MAQDGEAVAQWRRKHPGSDTPIFARTVSEVTEVTRDDLTSARDLSKVVGQDASMAARLLRIASSTLFNVQGRSIGTINEAVVLIGFDAVRELAISLALIEHVLKGRSHVRVTRHMAHAFHAAVQAKTLASRAGDRSPEEVFVATLLLRLGPMTFWAEAGEDAQAIEQLIASGCATATAEQKVLGFPLDALTRQLADDWKLGPLLAATLDGRDDERVSLIQLGDRLAHQIENHGWDAKETNAVLAEVAELLGASEAEVRALAEENLSDALKIADRYGVPRLDEALPPLPDEASRAVEVWCERIEEAAVAGKPLDTLLRLALQGVHEGLDMDRAYFALLSPDRRALQVRHAAGIGAEEQSGKALELRRGKRVQRILDEGVPVALTPTGLDRVPGWLADGLPCLVMPIRVRDQNVGLLYADRESRGGSFDQTAFTHFTALGQQMVEILSRPVR